MERPICPTCNKTFSRQPNLNKHLRESKSCSNYNNNEDNQECLWCKGKYDNIKNHIKSCKISKESIYSIHKSDINNLKDQLEKSNLQIKDLQDKLFDLANKTTVTNTINNTRTYNAILTCDKPLILNKKRVLSLLIDRCTIPQLKEGGKGICDWFLENVCVNDKGLICIECFDRNRKMFRYEDDNGKIKDISGDEIVDLIKSCFPAFKKTVCYTVFLKEVSDECDRIYGYEDSLVKKQEYVDNITYMKNDFIKRLIERTHKDSHNSSLGISYKEE
jgi:hypothetical protein